MDAARMGDASLPRAERLRNAGEIRRLFRDGARVEREAFVLLWTRAQGRRAAAFTAGRRVGGSVLRNRARRRLREAYRRQKECVPGIGVRLCLIARRGILAAPFPHLVGAVGDALRQAGRRHPA